MYKTSSCDSRNKILKSKKNNKIKLYLAWENQKNKKSETHLRI